MKRRAHQEVCCVTFFALIVIYRLSLALLLGPDDVKRNALVEQLDQTANLPSFSDSTLTARTGGSRSRHQQRRFLKASPRLVYHMHVPKTGGRSLRMQLALWLNPRPLWEPGCKVNPCCTPWQEYLNSVNASMSDSFREDYNRTCQFISHEISLSGMLETRKYLRALNATANDNQNGNLLEDWFTVSLFRHPIHRFVSVVRHHMRQMRCQENDMRRAVELKLTGKCPLFGHDRQQSLYYVPSRWNASDPFFPEQPVGSFKIGSLEVPINSDFYAKRVFSFDFVGLTHHMASTNCLLALELAKLNMITVSRAVQACMKNSTLRIQNTLEDDPDTSPLTTFQIMSILQHWLPTDAQVYAQVVRAFQTRLITTLMSYPRLSSRFEDTVRSLAQEAAVWQRVATWLRRFQDNTTVLYERLDGMNDKELLAPGMQWTKSTTPTITATTSARSSSPPATVQTTA